jgi:glycosyltransferase involved in cell wall biosynthesis
MKILFLSKFMSQGFGVSEVIQHLSSCLEEIGWEVNVLCEINDGNFKVTTFSSDFSLAHVQAEIDRIKPDVICAHTTPYIELLPHLDFSGKTIVYEHGEPSPELFGFDQAERQQIKRNKQRIYNQVSGVVAISDFIRTDIEYLESTVIYNGCDHIIDLGMKKKSDIMDARPLSIGVLSRLGMGESFYKNTELILDLAQMKNFELTLLGRGDLNEAKKYTKAGIRVILNANNEERLSFLRNTDVLVSPSLWEGFNLPAVEAQACGTVALAYDVGAHPEVTPFIASNTHDMKRMLKNWEADRNQLYQDSLAVYSFARSEFNWDRSAKIFAEFVLNLSEARAVKSLTKFQKPISMTFRQKITAVLEFHGFSNGTRYLAKKLVQKIKSYLFKN